MTDCIIVFSSIDSKSDQSDISKSSMDTDVVAMVTVVAVIVDDCVDVVRLVVDDVVVDVDIVVLV